MPYGPTAASLDEQVPKDRFLNWPIQEIVLSPLDSLLPLPLKILLNNRSASGRSNLSIIGRQFIHCNNNWGFAQLKNVRQLYLDPKD